MNFMPPMMGAPNQIQPGSPLQPQVSPGRLQLAALMGPQRPPMPSQAPRMGAQPMMGRRLY